MADINTVIADILVAQNDAYAVAGTESLSAQLATAQSQIATLTAELAALQAKITAAQADAAKVTTDLQ